MASSPDPKCRRGNLWLLVLLLLSGCSPRFEEPTEVAGYPAPDGKSRPLHVFLPDGVPPPQGWPTIVFFHGGAWQRGGPGAFHGQCTELRDDGLACISVGYRVAERDGSSVQDAVDDAHAAVTWLLEHAERWRLDPKRFVLGGGSAGGHLAAILATGQPHRPPLPVAALTLFNPTLDLGPGMPDHTFVSGDWESLSPLHQLRARLPPTLIMVGTKDPEAPLPSMREFCARARQLGGDCRLALARGQPHGFFNPGASRWFYFKTLRQIRRFLGRRDLI